MSSLVITKQSGNFFSLVLNGGSPIISEQNRLTTIGDFCNFKTANGANLILKQNILYSEITIITGVSHIPTSINDLWVSLIGAGFFDGVVTSGGGSPATYFTSLLDTFSSYIGRDGQVLVVNESMQRIETIAVSLFSAADRAKLDGIETNAEVNVQSDWNESDPSSDAFIANKPDLSASNVESIDFPRLIAPQQVFNIPTGKTAKWALVNGTYYVLETANNTAEFNTFTQSGIQVIFKNTLEIGEYPVIFYQ